MRPLRRPRALRCRRRPATGHDRAGRPPPAWVVVDRGSAQLGEHDAIHATRRGLAQVAEPDVVDGAHTPVGGLDRETGLADATGPDQRDHTLALEQDGEVVELRSAPDEAVATWRQAVALVAEGAQRRELPVEPVGRDLEDVERPRDRAQAMLAEVHQGDPAGHGPGSERVGRDQQLATVAGGLEPRRPVQRGTEVVAVAGRAAGP